MLEEERRRALENLIHESEESGLYDKPRPTDLAERRDLKVWPQFFDAIADGRKSFEVRRDDRGFKVGDTLRLREWYNHYTGRECERRITYILSGETAQAFGLQPGFVVLGLSALESAASGAVTDADAKAVALAYFYGDEAQDEYPADADFSEMRRALTKVLGPRLAKAEQRCKDYDKLVAALREHIDDAYTLLGDSEVTSALRVLTESMHESLPSPEPAPSDGQRSTCQWGAHPELGGWKCSVHGGFKAGAVVVLAFPCDKAPGASDGAYVDPWDRLTDRQQREYLVAALNRGAIDNDVALRVAQRMARDDAKKAAEK